MNPLWFALSSIGLSILLTIALAEIAHARSQQK
jgi:hypothetical protein